MAVQAIYSSIGGGHSHSRQSSSEHLPADNGPTQLHSSFSRSSAGLSAGPTMCSGGGPRYEYVTLVDLSPIDRQHSQSPHFEDFTTGIDTFPNNSSQQPTLMAALRPVFTITRFRLSGTYLQRGFTWLSMESHT